MTQCHTADWLEQRCLKLAHILSFAMMLVSPKEQRRNKRRRLLREQFQKLIPNCYQRHSRTVLAFPCCLFHRDAAEMAVWLWAMRIIPLHVQPVLAIIAMFIPRRAQPVMKCKLGGMRIMKMQAEMQKTGQQLSFATATADEMQAWWDENHEN